MKIQKGQNAQARFSTGLEQLDTLLELTDIDPYNIL